MRTESAALALEGEAGIGKTTLLREARRRAESAGSRGLACRPSAAEAKFSFSGLADLLSPVGDETFAALPDPQRDALQVALLRASPKQRPPLAQAVAAGFLGLIRDLARERPLLLAIDDVQWLDAPSLGALAFAARRLELENVGLLYSLRAPSADTALAEAVGDARLQRALLGPFSLGALGRIITDRIDQSLPRPVLVRIVQTCSGNPFYALEIARLVKERGADRPLWSELPVPDDLKALTASRLQALPQASRDALQLASVLAEPDGEAVDLDALASAEDAGIVTVDDRGRIRFVHPLFASAVYNS